MIDNLQILTHYYRAIISAVVLAVCATALTGCFGVEQTESEPFPLVPAKSLLLSARAFPPTWQIVPCGSGCNRSERPEHSTRSFSRVGMAGHVIQDVYAFSSITEALASFQHYRSVEFVPLQPPDKTFEPPLNMTYRSLLADDFFLGCGKQVVPACRTLFRYRNYVIEFYFDIDSGQGDGLQLQEIEPILRDMDIQVASTFNVSPSLSTPSALATPVR